MNNIRTARLLKGWTQAEVCRRTGGLVSQYRLSCIERGLEPKLDEAIALAHVLDLKAEPDEQQAQDGELVRRAYRRDQ